MKTKKRIYGIFAVATVLILAFALGACEGPEGPIGPEGPQGPAGETDPNCEHNWWSNWTAGNNKTCITGEDKRVCQGCLKIETRTNPLGHTVANFNISTQPTETTDGQGTFDCTRTGCATPTGNSVTLPAQNKFYGTWVYTGTNAFTSTITIDKTNFNITDSDGDYVKFTISTWTGSLNNSTNNLTNPSGYSFEGTRTEGTSYYNQTSFSVYLNKDGQSLVTKLGTGSTGTAIYSIQ